MRDSPFAFADISAMGSWVSVGWEIGKEEFFESSLSIGGGRRSKATIKMLTCDNLTLCEPLFAITFFRDVGDVVVQLGKSTIRMTLGEVCTFKFPDRTGKFLC